MAQRFLTIGECMVELAPTADGRYELGFAGDMLNSAWYGRQVAPPGWEVAFLSAIGSDRISRRMEAFIAEAGICPELTRIPGASVGLYLINLEAGERSFSYWRGQSAARRLARGLERLPGVGRGDLVLYSGITLAILTPPDRAHLLGLVAAARAAGARVAFDPNLRPALWEDGREMAGAVMEAAAGADILLPSFADEAAAFGDPGPEATAARYHGAGAALVVVKDGPRPVHVSAAGDGAQQVIPPAAPLVDSTAAGDGFNAGFLMALAQGQSPVEAAKAGCALAAKVIAGRGALVPL